MISRGVAVGFGLVFVLTFTFIMMFNIIPAHAATYKVTLRCTPPQSYLDKLSGSTKVGDYSFVVQAEKEYKALEMAQQQAKAQQYKCGANPISVVKVK